MADSLPHRLTVALVAGVAASALAAAPALATEGPAAPPPGVPLPSGLAPVSFPSVPSTAPTASRDIVTNARLVPRRVARGKRAKLKLSLTTPSTLQVVVKRVGGRKIRTLSLPARGSTVSRRLPARTRGHDLRPGRYRVKIFVIDAQGGRLTPVRRTLTVRHG